ncbi:UV damage endonuclease UvsE [Carnobacterium pleistocenium]|uniref:UV damage endonuclease UvsE n=1 Tax=Carnobacterium pleistocenium TaxID=181073 RepID=UPI000557EB6E|nr:UV damage endonuclease UvsE [Carnobacterium pleistocenium]
MNIQKIIALAILISGIILLVYGFIESNQISLITGIILIVITILDYMKLKNKEK